MYLGTRIKLLLDWALGPDLSSELPCLSYALGLAGVSDNFCPLAIVASNIGPIVLIS